MKNREQKAEAISEFSEGIGQADERVRARLQGHHRSAGHRAAQAGPRVGLRVRGHQEHAGAHRRQGLAAAEAHASTFTGMTAIAYNTTDPVALAKVADQVRQGRSHRAVQGSAAGRTGRGRRTRSRTSPTCRRARSCSSKLLYLMQHPIRGLAVVLNGTIRNLAVVLDQIAKQKGGETAKQRSNCNWRGLRSAWIDIDQKFWRLKWLFRLKIS